MTDLKQGAQRGNGAAGGIGHPSGEQGEERNRGAEFGAAEQGTRGTDRDADASGEAKNEGHSHPRGKEDVSGG